MQRVEDVQFGQQLLDAFDGILVINLKSRPDRRAEILAQFASIGIAEDDPRLTFVAAVQPEDKGGFPSIGARGCFHSHLKVLEYAMALGIERLLICEDDLDFVPVTSQPLACLPKMPWDIFYGGYAELAASDAQDGLTRVPAEQGIVTSHCIGLRGAAIASCHRYLSDMVDRAPGNPAGGPMHVDGAYSWFRAAHPEYVTFAAVPPIGVQRPSRSDIAPTRWYDQLKIFQPFLRILRKLKSR